MSLSATRFETSAFGAGDVGELCGSRTEVAAQREGHVAIAGAGLLGALIAVDAHDISTAGGLASIEQFEFESRFGPMLAVIGVTPDTAHVTLTPDRLVAPLRAVDMSGLGRQRARCVPLRAIPLVQ